MSHPERLAMVIGATSMGGAEHQLLYLLQGLDRSRFAPELICFAEGPLHDRFRAIVPVTVMPRKLKLWQRPDLIPRLALHFGRTQPSLVHGWMFEANFLGTLAGRLAGVRRILVSEHCAAERNDPAYRQWADGTVGRLATMAVANSEAGRDYLVSKGVPSDRTRVITNGIPASRAVPARSSRQIRAELGLGEDTPLVTIVARLDPVKDHRSLFEAIALLPDAALAVVGPEEHLRLDELAAWAEQLGIAGRVRLVGPSTRPADYLAAADVVVLCSVSEGQSNVLMEALMLGKQIVATDIPGNREVLTGSDALWAPVRDPAALARAIADGISRQRHMDFHTRARAEAQRRDHASRFSLATMVEAYQGLYSELLEGRRALRSWPA